MDTVETFTAFVYTQLQAMQRSGRVILIFNQFNYLQLLKADQNKIKSDKNVGFFATFKTQK